MCYFPSIKDILWNFEEYVTYVQCVNNYSEINLLSMSYWVSW